MGLPAYHRYVGCGPMVCIAYYLTSPHITSHHLILHLSRPPHIRGDDPKPWIPGILGILEPLRSSRTPPDHLILIPFRA